MRNLYLGLILLFSITINAQDWKTYPYEPEGSLISFPVDEGRHPEEPAEWWYTIGHVVGQETGTHYTFMLTYFYNKRSPYEGFRILNISNDDTGEFYDETLPLVYKILSEDSLNIEAGIGYNPLLPVNVDTWRNKVDLEGMAIPFEYELSASGTNVSLNLELVSTKRPLILGANGKFDQGLMNYTYYYSQTGNTVSGTINFKGLSEAVTGTGWIDRQYGSFDPYLDEKYEWFCLQLSNGMDINFWNLFTEDHKLPDNDKYRNLSAYVDEDTHYTTMDFKLERLNYKFTDDLMRCYSQKWHLTSPLNNIDLIFETLHSGTEVHLPFRFYEGATKIEGTVNGLPVTGVGFAELLHNYTHPEVIIEVPENPRIESVTPLSWNLENKDDGRPLFYNLLYSIDDKVTFNQIVKGLTDTFFVWNDHELSGGENCWIKVKSYSIDTTLVNETISEEAFLVSTATSVLKNKDDAIHIRCYPNPVHEKLYVSSSTDKINAYSIVDMSGKMILSNSIKPSNGFYIQTGELKYGVYILKLSTSRGVKATCFVKGW